MQRRARSAHSMASIACCVGALGLGMAHPSMAATDQFRGVNWADSRDNFQSGVLYVSGLSSKDTYSSALAVGTTIMEQFVSKLGANAVRMPINEATVSQYWSTYTGAIDAVVAQGKVVLSYWDSARSNKPPDMDAWWSMWKTVIDKYGGNDSAYFEVFNEPNMYSKSDLGNLYHSWLTQFPTVPKGRVILDGTGNAQNVSDVGSDTRLKDCLLAVHDYSFFGSESMTSESDWANHIKGEVGSYADRTICTEWGGPMSPGSKNGKSYDYLDYSQSPTNYFEGYVRGISSQLRTWKMGSFYWPGLRDGDWYSMTTKQGTGADITLSIPNQSGLERLQYAWGQLPTGGPHGDAGGGTEGGSGGHHDADAGIGGSSAGSNAGRPGASGAEGGGGRSGSGSGGAIGNGHAGAAGASAVGSGGAGAGQTGSVAGGMPLGSGGASAARGGTGGNSDHAARSGDAMSSAGGHTVGSDDPSGAGAEAGPGESLAGSSGPTSGGSCSFGRGARDSGVAWSFLLECLLFSAVRRRARSPNGRRIVLRTGAPSFFRHRADRAPGQP